MNSTLVDSKTEFVRIGISMSSNRVHAVAIDSSDTIVAHESTHRVTPNHDDIQTTLHGLLERVTASHVSSVMLASTVLNELLNSTEPLPHVGILRIGETTSGVPPLSGWPNDLSARVTGPHSIIMGGADLDGTQLAPLDRESILRFTGKCSSSGVGAITVSSVFSPISHEHELEAASLIAKELGGSVHVTLSHRVGSFGLLERESAAILNSSLSVAGSQLVTGVHNLLQNLGLSAGLFLAQNDGSLVSSDAVPATPIRILDPRIATAVRGAAHLADINDAIVVDHDQAVPRGGVLRVGEIALDFGRSSLAGVRVIQHLPLSFDVARTQRPVERLRHHARDAAVIAVGDVDQWEIYSQAHVPPMAEYASALGAATSYVSSTAWAYLDAHGDHESLIIKTHQRAMEEAILVGADPSKTRVIEEHESSVSYMTGAPRRLYVRAAGPPLNTKPDQLHHQIERNHP